MKRSSTPVSVKSRKVVSSVADGHRLLAARGQHRQRCAQDGAADAEAQRVDLLAAAISCTTRIALTGPSM
jgi:hypothetical protein